MTRVFDRMPICRPHKIFAEDFGIKDELECSRSALNFIYMLSSVIVKAGAKTTLPYFIGPSYMLTMLSGAVYLIPLVCS